MLESSEMIETPKSSDVKTKTSQKSEEFNKLSVSDPEKLRRVHKLEMNLMKENLKYFHEMKVTNLDNIRPELDTRKRNRMKSEKTVEIATNVSNRKEMKYIKKEFKKYLQRMAKIGSGDNETIDLRRVP